MKFDCSLVKNFRNFSSLKVEWTPGINLILGKNGSGKTNLLESLSILSGWGAFGKTRDVAKWDPELHEAGGKTILAAKLSGEQELSVKAQISSRMSLRLDEKLTSCTDLRLALPSITFSSCMTGGTSLIDGSPATRRLFIDRLCALLFPPFARRLAEFKIIARNRAALLKRGLSISATSAPFCKIGGWIMDSRRELVSQLISFTSPRFSLRLLPEILLQGEKYLESELERNAARELHALRPLAGPGYDELEITMNHNNRPAALALSQGQKRRLILSMITAAGKLIERRLKRKPVLLFDDLTAELDSEGREWTCMELLKTGWQVFITAPENPFSSVKNFNTDKFGGIDFSVS